MKIWALLNEEHFSKYLETKNLERSDESLQIFLNDMGTFSFFFVKPTGSNYKELPLGSCIRLRTLDDYVQRVSVLFPEYTQIKDKSTRSSSCTIV